MPWLAPSVFDRLRLEQWTVIFGSKRIVAASGLAFSSPSSPMDSAKRPWWLRAHASRQVGELVAEGAAQRFNLIGLHGIAGIRIDGSIVRLSPGIEFRLCARLVRARRRGAGRDTISLSAMPSMASL
jgi:hypothetical protein